jgi:hypothetical protein
VHILPYFASKANTIQLNFITTLAFSPDGHWLYWASFSRHIGLVDLTSMKSYSPKCVTSHNISALACRKNGAEIVSMSVTGKGTVFQLRNVNKLIGEDKKYLTPKLLNSLWNDLFTADPSRAILAFREFTTHPTEAVKYIGNRLRPIPTKRKNDTRLMTDLLEGDMLTSRKAQAELSQHPAVSETLLRKMYYDIECARQGPLTEPKAKRLRLITQTLDRIVQSKAVKERMRQIVGVQVLEEIGSQKSIAIIQRLSKGAPDAYLTIAARACLSRSLAPTKRKAQINERNGAGKE